MRTEPDHLGLSIIIIIIIIAMITIVVAFVFSLIHSSPCHLK